jgi:hypothetical protein
MSIEALIPAPCRAKLLLCRLAWWLIVAACLCTPGALPVRAQSDGGTPGRPLQGAQAPAPTIKEFSRQEGPFDLAGQRFTVVLQMKRLAGLGRAADPDFGETLATMAIKDSSGKVHFQATFPYEVSGDRFVETTAASAQMLRRRQGRGLLVTYGILPSTPLGGESWQVFGLFAGPSSAPLHGRLVPFSKPISAEGQLITGKSGERAVETSQEPGLQGGRAALSRLGGEFLRDRPAADPLVPEHDRAGVAVRQDDATRAEAYLRAQRRSRATPGRGGPDLRATAPGSRRGHGRPPTRGGEEGLEVEFLGVETEVVWKENADSVGLGVSDDVWIKIRIDGKEGWIHTQEDFQAIGLPQSG